MQRGNPLACLLVGCCSTAELHDLLNDSSPTPAQLERLNLELNTRIGAWAVLNITGDVRAWSLDELVASPGVSNSHQCAF